MERRLDCLELLFLLIYFSYAASFLTHCEARRPLKNLRSSQAHALKQHYVTFSDPYSNYLGSPNFLPPDEQIMGPSPSSSPLENPPYCIYPPLTPFPPSTTLPTPILPIQLSPPPPSTSISPTLPTPIPPIQSSPPPPSTSISPTLPTPILPIQLSPPPPSTSTSPTVPSQSPPSPSTSISPPIFSPNPPEFPTPGPPGFGPSPPSFEPSPPGLEPSPPSFVPSPPYYFPGPPEFVPGPPTFLPPIIYPPPTVPPPPRGGTGQGLWCVAKPTVPDPIIMEAMNYACGSGANCDAIVPNGACYQPNTVLAHASFAFNSYWQKTKAAGATCDFGGTAMLITKDPSYDGCHFNIN